MRDVLQVSKLLLSVKGNRMLVTSISFIQFGRKSLIDTVGKVYQNWRIMPKVLI